jgi:pyruvate/2-oxoglutarate dehydrogenase complex dihydrolipoamide acyltransferase (E2) component
MIESVVLERLGDTVDEVVIVEWFVGVGDPVVAGDPLLRVETDKVEVDIAAPVSGIVAECRAVEGDEVATGSVLCTIQVATD